jgi:hypothetical protein
MSRPKTNIINKIELIDALQWTQSLLAAVCLWSTSLELEKVLTFLGCIKEIPVFFNGLVDVDNLSSGEQLDDHAGGYDGRDTQFHESSLVRRNDGPQHMEGVGVT